MTKPTVAENADAIVTITMTETAAGNETDGHDDDDQRWAEAVITSLPSRSREARKALVKALWDGEGSMPLLGLELTDVENKAENAGLDGESTHENSHLPLLGTILLKSLDKNTEPRSSERVCYGSMLRFEPDGQDLNPSEITKSNPRGCYLERSSKWEISSPSKLSFAIASESALTRCPAP
ncbi:hypothetical protein [Qipengyuania huizhouensis]|uniref:hypothetical protein n=1 Tax=Qipengyuania huizhouensis TaxID=2867245 RepID=UPI001C88B49D|nr:hypothetical protein [Qipengyuania huizhouensis]MBX7459835.1 hypothetical protein [Qipengyuania huizhouensis]